MKENLITVTTHNINNNQKLKITDEYNDLFIVVQDCFIKGVMLAKGKILSKKQIGIDFKTYIKAGYIKKLTAKTKI